MLSRILLAFLLALAGSAAFGKWYVPWLAKRGAKQPLKDEVAAAIYAKKENDSAQGPGED